jgi:hypothetical protein
MKKYKIEVAVDTVEGENFVAWLNAQGHNAAMGTSTGNYVDGTWTSTDEQVNEIIRGLWESYCNS